MIDQLCCSADLAHFKKITSQTKDAGKTNYLNTLT